MACFLIDIDHTFAWDGSYEPHENAVETVQTWLDEGNQVIFITGRADHGMLRNMLDRFGLKDAGLITKVDIPRVLICDRDPVAIKHKRDTKWSYPQG